LTQIALLVYISLNRLAPQFLAAHNSQMTSKAPSAEMINLAICTWPDSKNSISIRRQKLLSCRTLLRKSSVLTHLKAWPIYWTVQIQKRT